MTQYTVLGPRGPRPPYGSFAGKPASGVDSKSYTQRFTVLGPRGPMPPYGSFAGKVAGAGVPTLRLRTIMGVGL